MNYNEFWDNVLRQEEWIDELIEWENAHSDDDQLNTGDSND